MKIVSLELINYRCFDNFKIHFAENVKEEEINLHVLIAPNMVGKSAVLKALRIAIGTRSIKIKANPANPSSLNISSEEHRVIGNNPFSDISRNVEIKMVAKSQKWNGTEWNTELYEWKKFKEDYEGVHTKTEHLQGDIIKDSNSAFNRVIQNQDGIIPLIAYIGTEYIHSQKTETTTLTQDGSAKQGYWYCLDDKSMEAYVFNWFTKLHETTIESEKSELAKEYYTDFANNTLNTFKKAIKSILPKITDVTWLKETVSKKKGKTEKYKLVFSIENEGVRTYEMLSDGFRYLILLIGELVTRATLLNKHVADDLLERISGVVLIDEFGIHLHPDLQSESLSNLSKTFRNVQFIVTTHSPLLINGLKKEQLHIISEDQSGQRFVTNPIDDAVGLGAEGILREMFGLETTYDNESIKLNEEYKKLLEKKSNNELTDEEKSRFEFLNKKLSILRIDPTLIVQDTEDPITLIVKNRLKDEAVNVKNIDSSNEDIEKKVNIILDSIFKKK